MTQTSKIENVKIETVSVAALHIKIGVVTFLKMFLRGITDLSFMVKLYGLMNQTAINGRAGVEMTNGDRIIAVRVSSSEAEIVTAYNKYRGNEDISGRVEALANSLFKITLTGNNRLTSKMISTVRR